MTEKELLEKITKVTIEIKENKPDVYRNLQENPIAMPNDPNPDVNKKELEEYLKTLEGLRDN
ncbi:MAG: hypothetical protein LAT68_10095 [Cyclobacteriaceae bacterium]|nr:hypothetical protein [Cyclobacteriaceae bacterium]MCH8516665.1 hypothetical protein [Cyclobacteriaceae bacterium]